MHNLHDVFVSRFLLKNVEMCMEVCMKGFEEVIIRYLRLDGCTEPRQVFHTATIRSLGTDPVTRRMQGLTEL